MSADFRSSRLFLVLGLWVLAPSFQVVARVETVEQARQEQAQWQMEMKILQASNNAAHTNDEATLARLQSLHLDGLNWPNLSAKAALADLTEKSREIDPTHGGVHFVLDPQVNPRTLDVAGRRFENNVCVVMRKRISFFEALTILGEQTNLAFAVQRNEVRFRQWQPDDYVTFADMEMDD